MRYEIRGENVEVTQAIRNYVEEKVEKIEKYFHQEIQATAHVKLKVNKKNQKVEITIPMSKLTLRAEERANDIYAAVDLVVDKLERQIRKHKTKVNRRFREQGDIKHQFLFEEELHVEEPEEIYPITKTKSFHLKPMDIEEAIMQMNMVGHEFFLFKDADTNHTKAVYIRNDGTYGIIETDN